MRIAPIGSDFGGASLVVVVTFGRPPVNRLRCREPGRAEQSRPPLSRHARPAVAHLGVCARPAFSNVVWGSVRGHEKVPTGGQV